MNIMFFPSTSLNALSFPTPQGKVRKHRSKLCWPPQCRNSCLGPWRTPTGTAHSQGTLRMQHSAQTH